MIASDGTVFERADTNAECCLTNSISKSEDGSNYRWPIVLETSECSGGIKKTYQEWIDFVSEDDRFKGICYEGWVYYKTGILFKSAIKLCW